MKIIDAEECSRLCYSIVKNAKETLAFVSPNCNIDTALLKKCNAKRIFIAYRKNENNKADMKERYFREIEETVKSLREEGKSVMFRGRKNLTAKCILNENKAVFGSVYFKDFESRKKKKDIDFELEESESDLDFYPEMLFKDTIMQDENKNPPSSA